MQVEIWSDVMCPFCYIGKRKFEMALAQFEQHQDVKIVWKSFQLAPDIVTDSTKNVNQYLSERKGVSMAQASEMNQRVTHIAQQVGLEYNLNQAIVANSLDAHRFVHLAKRLGLQNEAEEALFKAYFTEGKNTADHNVLAELGEQIGMDGNEVKQMLKGKEYIEEVENDKYEAHQIGVNGVPFFLFNNQYAISGAQEPALFLQALNTIQKEAVKNTL